MVLTFRCSTLFFNPRAASKAAVMFRSLRVLQVMAAMARTGTAYTVAWHPCILHYLALAQAVELHPGDTQQMRLSRLRQSLPAWREALVWRQGGEALWL